MLNKEIEKLLSCDNCNLKECIGCEISYTDRKKIKEYIEQLESKANKYDSLVKKIKDKVEELEKTRPNFDNNIRIYTLQHSIEFQISILQELLKEVEE